MSRVLEIACPADPGGPLHFAAYDRLTETLRCPDCGRLTTAELVAHLEDEMFRFEAEFPALSPSPSIAEDERAVESMAAKLLAALPGEAALAVELTIAWGRWALCERVPVDHLAACAERMLERREVA